jgi:CxxC-x17-CxxC domain-containing protein
MGNFNRFDRGDRGGRGFGGGHGDRPKQMHPATCSKCGQECEVPFRPTGDRPVFCSTCFKTQDRPGPKFSQPSFGGSHQQQGGTGGGAVSKGQLDALNAKLDKIISLLGGNKTEEVSKEKKEVVKKVKAPAKKAKGKKK